MNFWMYLRGVRPKEKIETIKDAKQITTVAYATRLTDNDTLKIVVGAIATAGLIFFVIIKLL